MYRKVTDYIKVQYSINKNDRSLQKEKMEDGKRGREPASCKILSRIISV